MSLFSKKNQPTIDPEQKELIENAQQRMRQKKNLYRHFVFFLAGAILLILMNLVLGIGKEVKLFGIDWFVWALLLWTFFFLVHLINVFLLSSFMNKQWEEAQIEKLVKKQKDRIAKLESNLDPETVIEEKKSPLPSEQKPLDPNTPL